MPFGDAAAYARFMGRYSEPLAVRFTDTVGAAAGQQALDVGCGAGALTAVLVQRLGPSAVCACDPNESFVRATRERLAGVEVEVAAAEELPYSDDRFDLVVAQLVVHFMTDPVGGIREMARVARPGGLVAASVWDRDGGPLTTVAQAARELDPDATEWSMRPGSAEGQLPEMFRAAGLADVLDGSLSVRLDFPGFEEWWTPYTLGVGPLGEYLAGLDPVRRRRVRDRCAEELPDGPFATTSRAWITTGRA